MVVVLIVGACLGSIVHSARIQRDAVAAIEQRGGSARYDCQGRGSFRSSLANGMWRLLGSGARDYWDYVFNVVLVEVGPDEPDQVMDHVARLRRLKVLHFLEDDQNSDPRHYFSDEQARPLRPNFTAASLVKVECLTGLEKLYFDRTPPLTDTDLAHLKGLTALRLLSLPSSRDSQVTDAGLANLANMTAITALDLKRHTHVTSAALGYLRGMPRLTHLWMSETQVDDLSPISQLTGLVDLRLDGTRITDAGLAPAAEFTNLSFLDIERTPITDAGLAHLRKLTRLKRLSLYKTRVTDTGLSHLAGLTALKSLDLADTAVRGAGLVHLAGLPALDTVSVHGTKVNDASLAQVVKLRRLAWLDLGKTQITDAGLKHLAGLGSLTTLNVAETAVTAAGLRQLVPMKRLTELVIGRDQASIAELAAILKSRPGLQIHELENGDPVSFRRYP